MPGDQATRGTIQSWVALDCADYRVCVLAEHVVSVDRDVGLARSEDAALPFLDLSQRWGGPAREVAPWVVWLQHGEQVVGVAVDEVQQFNANATLRPVPELGVARPDLFEGCFEHRGEVHLALSLPALVELTAEAS